jgi:hypothetical protein
MERLCDLRNTQTTALCLDAALKRAKEILDIKNPGKDDRHPRIHDTVEQTMIL